MTPPAPEEPVTPLVERDVYEVANQLAGYIGPDTEQGLASFLWRESGEAAKLADTIERLTAALEPFAEYAARNGFGLDNNGHEIPASEGVGWIYLTVGDFRRAAQALARTQGAQQGTTDGQG